MILKWIRSNAQRKLDLESFTHRLQLDSFRNCTIVRIWCIAPAALLKVAEREVPSHIQLNMQNDVMRWNHLSVKSWNSAPFVLLDIFKMAGVAPASEEVRSFTVLWSGAYFNCSSTVKQLRSWIALFENTGNLETWPWSWYVVLFVCFGGLGVTQILGRCWRKNRQDIPQNGHWKLETFLKAGLRLEGVHNHSSKTVRFI